MSRGAPADRHHRAQRRALADIGSAEYPAEVKALGSATGTISVALREVRGSYTSATRVVALETPAGILVGDDFLCAADRSDETLSTDEVAVTIAADVAIIRFRVSYRLDTGKAELQTHEIR